MLIDMGTERIISHTPNINNRHALGNIPDMIYFHATMKKQIAPLLFCSIFLFTASCKKNFTCECTVTESDGISTDTRTSSSELSGMTKLEALEECPKYDYINNNGYTKETKCELK